MSRRFLFCTRPGFGHVYPMLPLAAAARDAGHEVVFATGADAVPTVESFGFTTHRVGISIPQGFAELLGGAPIPTTEHESGQQLARRVFAEVLPPRTIDDLRPLCADFEPDVIVYGQWDVGAAVVAAQAGVPAFRHSVSRARPLGGDDRGALLDRYGVVAAEPDHYLDIYPRSLQEPAALDDPYRLALRPVAWPDRRAGVPSWVTGERSRPLAYLTLGSTPNDVQVIETALAGLSTVDVDVLVALGPINAADVRTTGEHVHLAHWVNQAEVLRHADFVVHHGGSGTTLGSLAAGLPQLVLPQRADQFVNAEVVARNGLGRALLPGDVTAAAVAAAAAELDGVRAAVAVKQAEIAEMPAPADVLARMLQIIEEREARRTCTAP